METENNSQPSKNIIEMNKWLINGLDILSELVKTIQDKLNENDDIYQIYKQAIPFIQKFLDIECCAFVAMEEDEINMSLAYVSDKNKQEQMQNVIDKNTNNGTFGWALCENRLVLVPDKETNKTILFHVLSTRNKVLGMFVGSCDISHYISDAAQKLVSVILLNISHTIENIYLIKDLKKIKNVCNKKLNPLLIFNRDFYLKKSFSRDSVNIFGICKPSAHIGGDYYDFFAPTENLANLTICDISGHGIPAGMFMTMVRSVIRTLGHSQNSPLTVITYLNHFLSQEIPDPQIFVTGVYGQFDSKNQTLSYVTAGHPAPWKINAKKEQVEVLPGRGMALGIVDNINYVEQKIQLESGDTIIFFTDGLYEMKNKEGEMLGESGLKKRNTKNRLDNTTKTVSMPCSVK